MDWKKLGKMLLTALLLAAGFWIAWEKPFGDSYYTGMLVVLLGYFAGWLSAKTPRERFTILKGTGRMTGIV